MLEMHNYDMIIIESEHSKQKKLNQNAKFELNRFD